MKHRKKSYLLPLLFILVSCGNNSANEYISFKDYVEIVKNEENNKKDIFFFTSSSCPHCQRIKPLLNRYVSENKDEQLNIYELSVDYRLKVSGQYVFKDETMGYLSGNSENDCLKALDNRLALYVNETHFASSSNNEIITGLEGNYLYVFTPLILWYQNGIEVKIVNNVEKMLEINEKGNFTYDSFVQLMDYPEELPNWNQPFNLNYYGK